MRLTKTLQNVLKVIERNPNCQNREIDLLERYWVEIDGWDESKSLYWNLQRATHPESVSRARRKGHELGLIKYSKDVENARYEAYRAGVAEHSKSSTTAEIVNPKPEVYWDDVYKEYRTKLV